MGLFNKKNKQIPSEWSNFFPNNSENADPNIRSYSSTAPDLGWGSIFGRRSAQPMQQPQEQMQYPQPEVDNSAYSFTEQPTMGQQQSGYSNSTSTSTPSQNGYGDIFDTEIKRANAALGVDQLSRTDGVPYSPDQVLGLRNGAVDTYTQKLNTLVNDRKNSGANSINSFINGNSGATGEAKKAQDYVTGFYLSPAIRSKLGDKDMQQVMTTLQGLPDSKKIQYIQSMALNSLAPAERVAVDNADSASGQIDYLLSTTGDVQNNPYKYINQSVATYLGGVKSPQYTQFLTALGNIRTPIQNAYYGAALSPQEKKQADTFLPDPATDDFATTVIKLQKLHQIGQWTKDLYVARALGQDLPKLVDYTGSPYFSLSGSRKQPQIGSGTNTSSSGGNSMWYNSSWN